jgi:hypothetical protein
LRFYFSIAETGGNIKQDDREGERAPGMVSFEEAWIEELNMRARDLLSGGPQIGEIEIEKSEVASRAQAYN